MRSRTVGLVVVCALIPAMSAGAQTIPGAVLARQEPHHHLAYEDSSVRVLRVSVPAKDTTLLHEHGPDYFWIALGSSTVVNARLGRPDANITSADLSIHYTVGKFAHVARNPGTLPFNNITVELLEPQGQVTNRCDEAVAGATLVCTSAAAMRDAGVLERPAFETGRIVVSLIAVEPGAVILGESRRTRSWFITLNARDAAAMRVDGTATQAATRGGRGGGRGGGRSGGRGSRLAPAGQATVASWVGGTWRAPAGGKWTVKNTGARVIQLLEVEPRS